METSFAHTPAQLDELPGMQYMFLFQHERDWVRLLSLSLSLSLSLWCYRETCATLVM